ncbi:MAG: hypothetical protein WC728_00015 [Elusimicrobiota bacterium]
MPRLTASLALLWVLSPMSWAAESPPDGLEFFKDEKAKLESLIRATQDIATELESAVSQLVDLRADYAKGTDPENIADRRRAVRSRAESLLSRMTAVEQEYNLRKGVYENTRTNFGLQRFLAEKRPPPGMNAELLYMKKLIQFSNRFAAVRLLAREELTTEENAFEEARRSARTRAIWTRIALLLLALAMAAGLGLFVRRRLFPPALPASPGPQRLR